MRRLDALVVLLFLVSGMSGLVFEVVWVRYLTLVIGHTTFAVSVVVSSFLGGLALGSLAIGGTASTTRKPLLVYASLEAATGALALAVTFALRNLEALTAAVGLPGGGPVWLRVLVTFALIVPPTAAMGATLPMLTRFVARELPKVGKHFGLLYGMNTFGAALGCALAGFYLIGAFGLVMTAALAAATNLLVACAAVGLYAATPKSQGEPSPDETATPAGKPVEPSDDPARGRTSSPRATRQLLVAAFALSGFASISYEVLWFRVLGFFLPSTSYAFTVLLVTFLVGLVLGAVLYATWLAGRVREMEIFVSAQLLLAFLGLVSMTLLGHSSWLRTVLHISSRGSWGGMLLHAAIIMLLPTTVIGVVFPAVVQLTTTHLRGAGKNVGVLYSVNTLGGIIGSLAMGFLAIPLIGTQWSFVLVSFLNALIAVMVVRVDPEATRRDRARTLVATGLLVPMMIIVPPGYLLRRYSETYAGETLRLVEGRDGILSVIQYTCESVCKNKPCASTCADRPWDFRQLRFASMSYAATQTRAKRYMATLANLPMLTLDAPKDVLLVCFGTGTTAGTFAGYSELASLTVVDLNPDVIGAAELFAKDNHSVLANPKTHVVIDDGRHFLLTSNARFDVISFEPPPPITAGTVSLYTREFYELIATRLNDDGLLTQWVPLNEQSNDQNRMLVSSLLAVFKDVSLWIPSAHEAVFLASKKPVVMDIGRWRTRWQEPAVRDALAGVGYRAPEELFGSLYLDHAALEQYASGHAPVTDDLPAVEYFFQHDDAEFDLASLLAYRGKDDVAIRGATADDLARILRERKSSDILAASADLGRPPADARRLVRDVVLATGRTAYTDFLEYVDYDCLAQ